jgi:hypothetical protein
LKAAANWIDVKTQERMVNFLNESFDGVITAAEREAFRPSSVKRIHAGRRTTAPTG